MDDRYEKTIDLKAPVSRVWRALTDYEEFGTWFRVKLEGPFAVGEPSLGWITYPGYEHMRWEAMVVAMEPERLFTMTWCPFGGDPKVDYSNEPHTVCEFRLEPTATGTRLTIAESGFSGIPDEKLRIDTMRKNSWGWDEQAKHIAAHVES